jgi:hypothetical protein
MVVVRVYGAPRRRELLAERLARQRRQLARAVERRARIGRRQRQRQYERGNRQRGIVADDPRASLFTDGGA